MLEVTNYIAQNHLPPSVPRPGTSPAAESRQLSDRGAGQSFYSGEQGARREDAEADGDNDADRPYAPITPTASGGAIIRRHIRAMREDDAYVNPSDALARRARAYERNMLFL